MSIKIKVSYETPEELQEILKRLRPFRSYKLQPSKGKYKRAYLDIIAERSGSDKSERSE